MKGYLGAGTDNQAIVLIPIGDDHMRLDVRLVNFWHDIFFFKDLVRLCKAFLNVSNINMDVCSEITGWIRIGEVDVFRLVMQAWRVRESEGFPR